MLLPRYKKLWEPYSKDGCSLERAVEWAKSKLGAGDEIVSSCVRSLMTELAGGKEFPKDGCDPEICACDMHNAHTAINHHLMRKVNELKKIMGQRYWQVIESMHRDEITKFVESENKKYLKEYHTPWYRKIFWKSGK